MGPGVIDSFSSEQLAAVSAALAEAIPKPSPKLVDLRFGVDLVFSRFYVVLFVGKDRRKNQRQHESGGLPRVGNLIAAFVLLVSANLVISACILLFAYLLKSAIGLDFLPEHISDTVQKLSKF
ncbi:hypothetical protein [Leptolyngbya sp. FACHB-261]|uniref:hypothetical protein n=1 Tax=Leptolyngbya sp. FACHB-261 TaxID=2692806 RepID=UPI001F557643|nr:hypothetical protein [Leptolyngbya sp. FACHB-261]